MIIHKTRNVGCTELVAQPTEPVFLTFSQCGWSEAKLARLNLLMQRIRPVSLNASLLSLAVSVAVKSL